MPVGASNGATAGFHEPWRLMAATAAHAQHSVSTSPVGRTSPASAVATPAVSQRSRTSASRQTATSRRQQRLGGVDRGEHEGGGEEAEQQDGAVGRPGVGDALGQQPQHHAGGRTRQCGQRDADERW